MSDKNSQSTPSDGKHFYPKVKITCEQFKPKLSNLELNKEYIIKQYNQHAAEGADLVVFTELCLSGYTPKDLLFSDDFLQRHQTCLDEIIEASKNKDTCLILPSFELNNGNLYNACYVIKNGEIAFLLRKENLANGEIFDEYRYFKPAINDSLCFTHKGVKIGLAICEDFWQANYYQKLAEQNPDFVIAVNASPYHRQKLYNRLQTTLQRIAKLNKPIIYLNQVLAQDGILFDGKSFVYNGNNSLQVYKNAFTQDVFTLSYQSDKLLHLDSDDLSNFEDINLQIDRLKDIKICDAYRALVFGLKEYVHQNGFSRVLIGISGGIDSALVATIASDAFGSGNVKGIFMPSVFTTKQSFEDAKDLAKKLKIELDVISIDNLRLAYNGLLPSLSPLAMENTQARIRGNILMAISNSDGSLLLTTGNKSEIATGYCTLYGDMCGAYNPIKDLYKTEVFDVARWRNNNILDFMECKELNIINQSLLTKAPSAELRDGQKDSDSLPDYPLLDKILYCLVEQRLSPKQSANKLSSLEAFKNIADLNGIVDKVQKLLLTSEYKRRQSAPGTRLSPLSFEPSDRRVNL